MPGDSSSEAPLASPDTAPAALAPEGPLRGRRATAQPQAEAAGSIGPGAPRATGPGASDVDPQLAAFQVPALEQPDRLGRLGIAGELHEGEPSRLTRHTIAREVDRDDTARRRQELCELLGSRLEAQVADEDPCWNSR